jgi:hypothetical protein
MLLAYHISLGKLLSFLVPQGLINKIDSALALYLKMRLGRSSLNFLRPQIVPTHVILLQGRYFKGIVTPINSSLHPSKDLPIVYYFFFFKTN